MKAFVTGATGFLGSHLVDRLLQKKWEVHVLVRKSSNLQWLLGKKVHYHYGDIVGDLTPLKEGLKGADVCFHLAGIITSTRPEAYYEVNAQGTANLLEAVLQSHPGIKKVVVVTSLAAHGPNRDVSPATEEDDCHPITLYGRSKRDAELIAFRYWDRLPITIIRPPAIYGPRDRQVFRYFWMTRKGLILLPGAGRASLNIAYVQDIVTGLLLAAEKPQATGEIFFIGDGKNYTWEEVAAEIALAVQKEAVRIHVPPTAAKVIGRGIHWLARLAGRPDVLTPDHVKNFLQTNWALDIGKARRLLGYEPATPLRRGVEETAVWYFENHWLRSPSKALLTPTGGKAK